MRCHTTEEKQIERSFLVLMIFHHEKSAPLSMFPDLSSFAFRGNTVALNES